MNESFWIICVLPIHHLSEIFQLDLQDLWIFLVSLCLRLLQIKCSLFSSHKGGQKKQIFVSAVAVSLAAEAA